MRFRKILSIVLALCLLTALLPLQTFAAAESQPVQQGPMYAEMRDSAHYPKIQIQEVTPESEDAPEESDALWEGTKTYAPTYLTVEKAAVKLREYMKDRQTSFTLYVKSSTSTKDKVVEELLNKATTHTGNPTEGDYLLWHIGEWGGQVTKLRDGASGYTYQFRVEMSYYTTAAQEKELTTAVNSLLKTLNVKNKSDYEKVKAVYDYICKNITYDYTHLEDENYLLMYTAYAALVNKTAVCQGYATLLYRLLLELGVDCRVITGLVFTGEPHAWNIVKLGSVYYNLDSTWDAGAESYAFFLRNSAMNTTHYRYLDYCGLQFHRDYPMSSKDYEDGVDGVPEHVFASGVCGDNAYWTLDWDGLLIISGTGATYDYSQSSAPSYAAPWAYWHEGIKTVHVEEGITTLGANLFCWDNLTRNIVSVTLPESLTDIGMQAFRDCDQLTQIRIPDGVKKIGNGAFMSCDNLQTVTLGNSLETIDFYAFYGCRSLSSIQFPESLKRVWGSAFQYCDVLTEVTIPASVEILQGFNYCTGLQVAYISAKSIGVQAFIGCENLHTVVLTDHVTQIQASAFSGCKSLQSLTIPKSVEELGSGILNYCASVKEIRFEGDAPTFDYGTFSGFTAPAYYPAGNETWTKDVLRNYSGYIVWNPYCADHRYEMVPTPATCTESGGDVYTCPTCGDSYVENVIPALGHKWSEGSCETPRICTVCGESSGHDGHIYDDGVDGTCNACGIDRVDTVERTVVHMFRMYNPNTGEHFYTGSTVERDNLVAVGWQYEGIGFTFPANTGLPVHRLFQPSTGEHLYTMDEAEKNKLMADGWNYEGIALNSAYDTEAVQHRLHNPNAKVGAYHFTFSIEERDTLIAAGWEYQGIGWYSCWK